MKGGGALRILFGVRTFGRVDGSDGFRVVTRFFHISYFPLIPLGGAGFLLFPGSDDGISIPLSGKSVLFAYLRGALALGAVIGLIDVLSTSSKNETGFLPVLGCAVAFGLSYPLSRPSAARKEALLRQASSA